MSSSDEQVNGSRAPESPPLLGYVELPTRPDASAHNGRVVRFRGWVASTRGLSTAVRYRVGRGDTVEIPTDRARPDIVAAFHDLHGVDDLHTGFEFYLDVPRYRRRAAEVTIELTDGEVSIPKQVFRIVKPDGSVLETYEADSEAKRDFADRYLTGRGLEMGALHQPLHLDPGRATVQYADRLTRAQALETWPELREHFTDQIVEPDFLVDLDTGDLSSLEHESFDFFVANDVIEHLANPLRFLEAVHDVMGSGAVFFLSAPDCDFTFDVRRALTSDEHLWGEYEEGVSEVSDEHIRDFVEGSEGLSVPHDPPEREQLFRVHRERSIHVHVWNQASFDRFLDFAIDRLDLRFDVLDRGTSRQAGGAMVYVLRKR